MVHGSWSCIEIQMLIPLEAQALKAIDRKSFERGNFLVLHPVLLKIAYFKSLIDSFPLTYSPKSCDKENLSIPLEPNHKAQSSEIFLSFQAKKWKRNWELFNGVRVMALYWSKIVDPSRSPCLRTVQRKSFERGNFLVLRPVLMKNAYFNSANR